jgi:hypothetical protein
MASACEGTRVAAHGAVASPCGAGARRASQRWDCFGVWSGGGPAGPGVRPAPRASRPRARARSPAARARQCLPRKGAPLCAEPRGANGAGLRARPGAPAPRRRRRVLRCGGADRGTGGRGPFAEGAEEAAWGREQPAVQARVLCTQQHPADRLAVADDLGARAVTFKCARGEERERVGESGRAGQPAAALLGPAPRAARPPLRERQAPGALQVRSPPRRRPRAPTRAPRRRGARSRRWRAHLSGGIDGS